MTVEQRNPGNGNNPTHKAKGRSEKFKRSTVLDAYDLGKSGGVGDKPLDWWDSSCPGLMIRIQKTKAVWYFRDSRAKPPLMVNIRDVAAVDCDNKKYEEVQRWVREARLMVERGERAADIKEFLQDKGRGGKVVRHFNKARDGWTWVEGRDAWLNYIKTIKSQNTFEDYEKVLTNSVFDDWVGTDERDSKLLKHITRDDVAAIRDAKFNEGHGRASEKTLGNLKSCLRWCAQTAGSGITVPPGADIEPREYVVKRKDDDDDEGGRVPGSDELGDLPWLLDRAPRMNPAKRLAAMLVLATAQRRWTVATARRRDFEADDEGGGIWTIPSQYVKSGNKRDGRPHVVPLPPLAWHVVQLAMTLGSADDTWLFPQQRLRRASDPGGGHMARESAGRAMVAAGSSIRPHDVRRGFATYGEAVLEQPLDAISIILDHAEGREKGAAERAAMFNLLKARRGKRENTKEVKAVLDNAEGRISTTSRFYALHEAMHVKLPLMRAWEQWLLELMAERAPKGADPLPRFLGGFKSPTSN